MCQTIWRSASQVNGSYRIYVIVQRGLRRLCAPLITEGATISPPASPIVISQGCAIPVNAYEFIVCPGFRGQVTSFADVQRKKRCRHSPR